MLTKEEMNLYAGRLRALKEKFSAGISSEKKMLDFGSDSADIDEEADETEELGNELGIETALTKQIGAIDSALEKIKNGKYGLCEKCGGAIDKKILDAAPESTLCGACKSHD